MSRNAPKQELDQDNINLDESDVMNQEQQALFHNLSRGKSADSIIRGLFHLPSEGPDRSLVWDMSPSLTNNIIINNNIRLKSETLQEEKPPEPPANGGLHIFRKVKKQKVRGKCDYDKNICGYITKKVIREFVSKSYEKEVNALVKKYHSNYAECKAYYLRKVQMVTGPSHLPELLTASPNQPESVGNCKKVFKQFYRWFLKERYLRYLLIQGKMRDKQAYIQYKNNNLFKYLQQQPEQQNFEGELEYRMHTRSRSAVKIQNQQDS